MRKPLNKLQFFSIKMFSSHLIVNTAETIFMVKKMQKMKKESLINNFQISFIMSAIISIL